MKLLVGLASFLSALALAGSGDVPFALVPGISRTIEFDRPFGSVHLTDPKTVVFRRVVDGETDGATKLLLIPLALGKTDLTVHEPDNMTRRARYLVEVTEDAKVLARIKAEERAKGLPINDLELTVGISFTENFPKGIGPIYLTDPKVLDYRRMALKGTAERLLVIPTAAGRTDLTIHDTNGRIEKRYFITVSAAKK